MNVWRSFIQVSWSTVIVIAGLIFAPWIHAQPPGTAPLPPARPGERSHVRIAPPANQPTTLPSNLNDPTIPSPEIRSLITPERGPNAPAAQPTLPTVRLRARIIAPGKPGLALLDIGGVLVTVREGDRVPVRVAGVSPMKCTKLTAQEVELEITDRQQVLIVN